MRNGVLLAAVLATWWAAAGCSSSAVPEPEQSTLDRRGDAAERVPIQLIVRFRTVPQPSDSVFLSRLSKAIGTPIAYVRPMSGGAHVLRVVVPPDAVAEIVRRLENRPEVVDVQPDVRVRPQ